MLISAWLKLHVYSNKTHVSHQLFSQLIKLDSYEVPNSEGIRVNACTLRVMLAANSQAAGWKAIAINYDFLLCARGLVNAAHRED